MKRIRIGIISAAHHHVDGYLSALKAMEKDMNLEIVGMADEDEQRLKRYAAEWTLKPYPHAASLLRERPDAIIICSENTRHRLYVEQAAAAGVHILCEKPLAADLADAQAMVELCRDKGLLLMPAFPMRYSQAILEARNALQSGQFGALRGGSSTNQGQMPMTHRHWFIEPEMAGGGVIMDHTVHVVDLLRWLSSAEPMKVSVFANRIMQPSPTEVETAALLLIHFSNGLSFSLDASWSRPQRYPTWGGLTLRLVCDRGILEVDAFSENNQVYGAQDLRWEYWGADVNRAMLADFLAALRGDTPRLSADDGLAAQRLIDAAYRSWRQGKMAEVNTR